MTLRPDQIGDKGQRYEVRFLEGEDDESKPVRVFGWSNDLEGAQEMAKAWKLRPSVTSAWVVDRQPPPPINECSQAPEASPSGAHDWFDFKGLPCCRQCGIIRRRDGMNKPCKGVTRLRPMEGAIP